MASLLEEEPEPVVMPPMPDPLPRIASCLVSLLAMWTGLVAVGCAFFLALHRRWDLTTLMYALGGGALVLLGLLAYR
jgi:hypothetical protein